jgi:hypothetical protein|tara:strand:+ start:13409 stop:14059 length:651 start_codon:yes stop_codon:yes gene_type:complete
LYYTYGQLIRDEWSSKKVRGTQYPIVKIHDDIQCVLSGVNDEYPKSAKEVARWLNDTGLLFLHVVRDGRDVFPSFHRMRKGTHSDADCSLSEFIRQRDMDMSRVRVWATKVRSALEDPNVHVIKYEDIVSRTEYVVENLAEKLDMEPRRVTPLLPPRVQSAWQGRFARVFQIRPSNTNILGDTSAPLEKWAEVTSPRDLEFFNKESGSLLDDLGYT